MKHTLLLACLLFTSLSLAQPAKALDFDGTNDYVNLGNHTAFNFSATSTFSIEFWMKFAGTASSNQTIIGRGHRNAGKGFTIKIENNTIYFRKAGAIVASTSTITPGQWTHVAVTYNNTAVKIYINGIEAGTGNLTLVQHAAPYNMYLGARHFDNGTENQHRFFKGVIDELRFWNLTRSAAEILSNKDCTLDGGEPNLISFFKFDQGMAGQNNSSETSLINTKNTVYNGTLNGFALNGAVSNFVSTTNTLSDCTLSNEEVDFDHALKIYPLPAKDQIRIAFPKQITIKEILLYDLHGRLVIAETQNNIDQNFSFNLPDLNPGLYLLNIRTDVGTATRKIMVK